MRSDKVLTDITRTDLNYPVGVIIQFMAPPTEEHLQCAQCVLRYVSGSKDRGLLYRTSTAVQLVGYTDADWAGNAADRRSTSRYAVVKIFVHKRKPEQREPTSDVQRCTRT